MISRTIHEINQPAIGGSICGGRTKAMYQNNPEHIFDDIYIYTRIIYIYIYIHIQIYCTVLYRTCCCSFTYLKSFARILSKSLVGVLEASGLKPPTSTIFALVVCLYQVGRFKNMILLGRTGNPNRVIYVFSISLWCRLFFWGVLERIFCFRFKTDQARKPKLAPKIGYQTWN